MGCFLDRIEGSTKVHGGLFSSGRIQNKNDVSFTQGRNDAGLLPSLGGFIEFDNVLKSPVPQAPIPQALVTDLQPITKGKGKGKCKDKSKRKVKSYILAPFLIGPHYVLFIISPKQKRGYILDSLKGTKNEKSYPFSKVVEDSFEGNFTWAMVNCKQQLSSWECGFMILKHMFEFVLHEDASPTNIWNDTSLVTQPEIDVLIENIMKEFLKVLDEASNVGQV
ncbi:hypothetical protein QVD17_41371 [Tagetes erecta]|uniref:Ubiquitin-like protease family profile domain-containing protein n=1 Tax=Tagetes erecta TaxID=13708 RepID=A0AAD8JM04_TARER|nr:hypothetical protein QVD17_41371 [Tagetes erecta]